MTFVLNAVMMTVRNKKLRQWTACVVLALCTIVNLHAQDNAAASSSPDNSQVQAPVSPPTPSQTISPPTAPQTPIQAPDYLIGTDDVLDVYIIDVPELSRQYRVSGQGTVTVPMLATPVKAAGLTLSQFSGSLTNDLKKAGLVSDPHVNTTVNQSRLHAVAITGSVKRPQIYS